MSSETERTCHQVALRTGTIGIAPSGNINPDGSSDTIIFGASFRSPNGLVFDAAGKYHADNVSPSAVVISTCS